MQTKFTELSDCQWEFIEKYVSHHKPRKHSIRTMINAMLWITRTGSQWRNMESKYPPWQSVYYYFDIWTKNGLWDQLLLELVKQERKRKGRDAVPSAVAIDSQSIKVSSFIDQETAGIDGGKKINGRKRHIIVDSLGLLLATYVSPANTHDGEAGLEMLWQLDKQSDRLALIRADGSYGGIFKKVTEELYEWKVETTKKPPSSKGFVPQKGRWQVERSFGWLNFFRRLAKDCRSSQAFVQLAFISVILNRLA